MVNILNQSAIGVDAEITAYMSLYNVTFECAVTMYKLAQKNQTNALLQRIALKLGA